MPRWLRAAVLVLLLGGVAFFALRWVIGAVSPPPDSLGVGDGTLRACPASPNCVSTRAEDEQHGIEPIPWTGETAEAQARLAAVLAETPGATVVEAQPGYIWAEFRTPVWHFIDDVEFQFDETEQVIHFRSASRLGYGDMGTNRQRMEQIREAYQRAR